MKFKYDKASELVFFVNRLLPFKRFKYMNICGILVTRLEDCIEKMTEEDIIHEKSHTKQLLEMGIIFYYIWYVLEWLVRLVTSSDSHSAYRSIAFEQEVRYLETHPECKRKVFDYGWIKWLTK